MCIRDSLEISNSRSVDWAGNINGAFNKLTENNSLISMIIGAEIRKNRSENSSLKAAGFYDDALNFIGPVSYTHLDVYKRQEVEVSIFKIKAIIKVECLKSRAKDYFRII